MNPINGPMRVPGVKTDSAMQMKLLLISCFLLGACTASYLAEKREGIDQNYESMIIFIRPFLFPSVQWCYFYSVLFYFTCLDAPLSEDTGHFKKLLSYF